MDGRPFISGAPFYPSKTDSYEQIHPRTLSLHHLSPYGTPITPKDPTRSLWICMESMQNTQFAFQLYNDRINLSQIIESLICLNAQMFVPISPNIKWNNPSNWVRTKKIFKKLSRQVHLSAISNIIGKDPEHIKKSLVGGTALLTFGLWSTKVSHYSHDPSGHGTFSITTIQGKNIFFSFIAAYIAVNKGSNIGVDSINAQQTTLYKRQCITSGEIPNPNYCPR
jgi:hypothetical protein